MARDNASCTATNAARTSPSPVPPPSALATHPLDISGSASLPGAFTASTDAQSTIRERTLTMRVSVRAHSILLAVNLTMALVCI